MHSILTWYRVFPIMSRDFNQLVWDWSISFVCTMHLWFERPYYLIFYYYIISVWIILWFMLRASLMTGRLIPFSFFICYLHDISDCIGKLNQNLNIPFAGLIFYILRKYVFAIYFLHFPFAGLMLDEGPVKKEMAQALGWVCDNCRFCHL